MAVRMRPLPRRHRMGRDATPWIELDGDRSVSCSGGALTIVGGPAGPVGPVPGTDLGFQGMDPSNPLTWVRPYNPVPGMISFLNFDGAHPNRTQTV